MCGLRFLWRMCSCSSWLDATPWLSTSLWAVSGCDTGRRVQQARPLCERGPWLVEKQPRGQGTLPASAPLASLAILKAPNPHVLHLPPTPHLLKIPGGAPVFPHLSLTGTLGFCYPGRLYSWIPSISGQRTEEHKGVTLPVLG